MNCTHKPQCENDVAHQRRFSRELRDAELQIQALVSDGITDTLVLMLPDDLREQLAQDWNEGREEQEAPEEEPHRFRNFYRCPKDGTEWNSTWSCQCNDACPTCGMKDIEPLRSEDL